MIKICRIFKIDIYLHISWFIIFALITIGMASVWKSFFGDINLQVHPFWNYLLSAGFAIALYICMIAHELSHSLVANKLGIPVRRITLFMLGGIAQPEKPFEKASQEFKAAIAGPLCSLLIAVFLFGLTHLLDSVFSLNNSILTIFLSFLSIVNLFLAIFNLVPAFPMDGGRVLRSILWHFFKDLLKATKIAVYLSIILSTLLILSVFTRFGSLWCVFVGLFIIMSALGELRSLQNKLNNQN